MVNAPFYQVRVLGALGPAARKAFEPLQIEVEPTTTLISGRLTQAGLHELLDRVRGLAVELIDIRQAEPPTADSDLAK